MFLASLQRLIFRERPQLSHGGGGPTEIVSVSFMRSTSFFSFLIVHGVPFGDFAPAIKKSTVKLLDDGLFGLRSSQEPIPSLFVVRCFFYRFDP